MPGDIVKKPKSTVYCEPFSQKDYDEDRIDCCEDLIEMVKQGRMELDEKFLQERMEELKTLKEKWGIK